MKKIISLMLVLVMSAFALISCSGKDAVTEEEWKAAFNFANVTVKMTQTYTEDGETETNTAEYRFVDGKLFGLFGGEWDEAPAGYEANITYGFDFAESFGEFTYADKLYTAESVTLKYPSASVTMTAKNIEVALDNSNKLVSVKYDAEVVQGTETITGAIEYKFSDFGKTVAPEMGPEVLTHSKYMAAESQELVTIEAYVQAKQGWWADKAIFYLQDQNGGYIVYDLPCTEEEYNAMPVGTKIRVTGYKAIYNGLHEIYDSEATFEILEGTWVAEAEDLTALLGNNEALTNKQGVKAIFSDMTVKAIEYKSGKPGDDIYVTLTKDGVDYDFCVEVYLTGTTTDVYSDVGELTVGDVIDVECFVYWWNDLNPHVTAVTKK